MKKPDGSVNRIGHDPPPKITRLIPRDYWDTNDYDVQSRRGA